MNTTTLIGAFIGLFIYAVSFLRNVGKIKEQNDRRQRFGLPRQKIIFHPPVMIMASIVYASLGAFVGFIINSFI
jgi:uncharacterized membrane protein